MGSGRCAGSRSKAFTLVELLLVIAVIAVLCGLLLRHSQPGMRYAYYQGKDQITWIAQLRDEKPEKRQEAIEALCVILRWESFPCRCVIVNALANLGPDAQGALPTLRELVEDDDENRDLRRQAWNAVERIDPKEHAQLTEP